MIHKRAGAIFLVLCCISGVALSQGTTSLRPGQPVEREIAGGESHTYQISLQSGQFMHVVVEQKGIDVALALIAPDGKQIAEGDLYTGAFGQEPLSHEAVVSGDYRIVVRPIAATALKSAYQVRLEVKAAATAQDKQRISAERLLAEVARLSQQRGVSVVQTIEKAEKALTLWRDLADRYWEARTLHLIGIAYASGSKNDQAIQYYEQALAIHREVKNRAGEGMALGNLGLAYGSLSRYEKAIEYQEQALAIHREVKTRAGEGNALTNLGFAYISLSRYEKSIEYLEQALAIHREVRSRVGEGATLNILGIAYRSLGRHESAIEYYEQSLAISREIKNRGFEGNALGNLGNAYFLLSRYEKAIEYHEQALAIHREVKNRVGEAGALGNLGIAHNSLGRYEKAIEYYEQVLAISRETKNRGDEGGSLENLGGAYFLLNRHEKAIAYHEQALAISREVKNRAAEGASLNNLGVIHSAQGRHDKAAESFEQSLAIRREVKDRLGEALTLHAFAKVERDRGNLAQSRALIEQSLQIVEASRSEIYNPQSRASYFASAQTSHEFYIDLLMQQHKVEPAKGLDTLAVEASERARARGLLELLTEAGTNIRQGVDAVLLERERALSRQLNANATRQMQLLSKTHTPEQARALTQELSQLENDYERAQAAIRKNSPHYAALTQPQPSSLAEIQQQLDAETLLLEYSLGSDRSYLWAITNNSLTSYELPKEEQLKQTATQVLDMLTARTRPQRGETPTQKQNRIAQSDAQLPEAARQLSQTLLGPVAAQLGNKRLVIVADGALQYIPFAMLPEPERVRQGEGERGRQGEGETASNRSPRLLAPSRPRPVASTPLIVKHEIVSLPSAAALAIQRRELAGRQLAPKMLAVIADPVFDRTDARFTKPAIETSDKMEPQSIGFSNERTLEHLADKSDDKSGNTTRQLVIPRLPFTKREADQLLALTPPASSFRATDFHASRATALDPALSQYRYVHFATHGLLDSERPGLSSLVLSMVDAQGKQQDGFLRANDIYNLKLPAELVVLSACQTGLGKEIKGEGLVGLTRGFMYAGAARVVVSLWSVNDKATAELMTKFYEKMLKQGERPAAALRAAQIEMWKQKQWQSPYYWAAFTMQGEWR